MNKEQPKDYPDRKPVEIREDRSHVLISIQGEGQEQAKVVTYTKRQFKLLREALK